MWGEGLQGVVQTVAHGQRDKSDYVPSAELEKLRLWPLAFNEAVLLFLVATFRGRGSKF